MTRIDNVEAEPITEVLLEELKNEKYPISTTDLRQRIGKITGIDVSKRKLERRIEDLKDEGYDFKKITSREDDKYTLLRHADTNKKSIYRKMGELETPILLTGDWHIGHNNFSIEGWRMMMNDIDDYNIKHVVAPGDILQGLGVHRVEDKDLKIGTIDEQMDRACDLMMDIPNNVDIHTSIGNHEEKIKGKQKVGFDPLKAMSKRLDNFDYYGSVMSFDLNGEFDMTSMHASGSPTYTDSYKLQKIWRNLPDPRPDVLHIGHVHEILWDSKPGNKLLLSAGTLQRETSYVIWKGYVTEVGWLILEEFEEGNKLVRERTLED